MIRDALLVAGGAIVGATIATCYIQRRKSLTEGSEPKVLKPKVVVQLDAKNNVVKKDGVFVIEECVGTATTENADIRSTSVPAVQC